MTPGRAFFVLPALMIAWTGVSAGGTVEPNAGAELQAVIDQARTDLVGRLGVTEDAIELVEAQTVRWPDSSLGCPEPGKYYLQALRPGTRVVLRAAGRLYHYHAGGNTKAFLCKRPRDALKPGPAE